MADKLLSHKASQTLSPMSPKNAKNRGPYSPILEKMSEQIDNLTLPKMAYMPNSMLVLKD